MRDAPLIGTSVDNLEAAKAFANSTELKTAMNGAGVIGAPAIWFSRRS